MERARHLRQLRGACRRSAVEHGHVPQLRRASGIATLPRHFRQIREVARRNCDSISLGELLRNTRPDPLSLIRAGQWLQVQLPIRFGRRIEDFMQLPHVVVSNPEMHAVLETYLDTFDAITAFPKIEDANQVGDFRDLLKAHIAKHGDGTRLVADGYKQLHEMFPHIVLDAFFNDLFTTRIATRILMENFVTMHAPQQGYVGIVRKGMRPLQIVQGLAKELIRLTERVYGQSPEIEYRGNLDCTLDYIPRHVSYMVQEVLKNALRATVERHRHRDAGFGRGMPPVVVELQKGDVHVIIKISDQGGGMDKSMQKQAWQYGWTTARDSTDSANDAPDEDMHLSAGSSMKQELAGYGFGLPLTRLHAQYFGGDVFMQALPGHGTDMYLLLTHLKEGTPSTEIDDLATLLESSSQGARQPPAAR